MVASEALKWSVRVAAGAIALAASSSSAEPTVPDNLLAEIRHADEVAFESFNQCSDLTELRRHEESYSASVEFYHETNGVTWGREAAIANTRKFFCGKYRRELISGSLKVFPLKDFGAIAMGTHRFCRISDNKCTGLGDFTIVWRRMEGRWLMTRVLSYGHRAIAP